MGSFLGAVVGVFLAVLFLGGTLVPRAPQSVAYSSGAPPAAGGAPQYSAPAPAAPAAPSAPQRGYDMSQPLPGAMLASSGPVANTANQCRAIHDYVLDVLPEVATSGTHIEVQYWVPGEPGSPERELLMPAREARGGRFLLSRKHPGHVWEYANCTDEQARALVEANIQRRREGRVNAVGLVDWRSVGFVSPVQ